MRRPNSSSHPLRGGCLTRTSGVINSIPGSPARTTSSTFYATTEYWNRGTRYLRAINTTSVGAASTTNTYDNALTTANLTQQSSWNSESSSNIIRSWTYTLPSGAVNGNVVTETDPNEIVTKTTYDALNLYPTQVDVAFGRTEKRTTKPSHDFNSGLLLSSTDDNNLVTVTNTYDNLGRPKEVEQSGNGGLYRSTSTSYDDVALSSTATQDQTALASTTYYDPLGRVRLTVDAPGAKIQKAYRVGTSGVSYELESNPYTTIDATMGWTLTTRNAISATATVQTYKGTDPPVPWGTAGASNLTGTTTTTAYDHSVASCSGPTSNVTDPSNNTTKYCQDGLGRLAGVTDAAGNLTQYSYDLLDDLIKVTQSGQSRAFEYSSLGRLLKACNPETGTASCTASPLPDAGLEKYTYDANGNLKTKKDARSITATYSGYDGLNRPQTLAYTKSDGTPEGTPTVTYAYDQDWKGALSSVSTTVGTSAFSTAYTHDGFGRIQTSTQTTVAAPGYTFVYTYDLNDQLTKVRYPSGRTVSYVPDSVGRISAVKNEATGQYYAQNIGYTPSGAMSTITLGNGVVEQRTWNDRLQLTGLTATRSGATVLGLGFYPCSGLATSCASGNTGNVQGQTIAFPGLSLTQNYTYDVLARIGSVNEGAGSWKRGYGYDAVGNRYVDPDTAKTSGYTISSFTPTATSNFDANNRLGVNNSAYDPSGVGNQTAIGGYSYTYDAENRMITANLDVGGTGVSSAGYVYDGRGQRVQKITCPAGTRPCNASATGATATTYVYDAFGELAAEYGASSGTQAGCGTPTCYVSVDQIGSTRVVTDANGNAVRRYDYTPFGEELWAGTGGRTTAMGYQSAPDGFNPKFTGQYRDTENFLDYFRARYHSPQQGRFVSVDPENAGAAVANPQTWNGYAYVGNNPLNITDPNGESWITALFGAVGFIGGAFSGGTLWWYTAIMTAAKTAAFEYSFEKAVNSGNIAAIVGNVIGGPPTMPDYGGKLHHLRLAEVEERQGRVAQW